MNDQEQLEQADGSAAEVELGGKIFELADESPETGEMFIWLDKEHYNGLMDLIAQSNLRAVETFAERVKEQIPQDHSPAAWISQAVNNNLSVVRQALDAELERTRKEVR